MKRCAAIWHAAAARSDRPPLHNPVTLATPARYRAISCSRRSPTAADLRDAVLVPPELLLVSKIAGPEWLFEAVDTTMQLPADGVLLSRRTASAVNRCAPARFSGGQSRDGARLSVLGDTDACELCAPFAARFATRLRSVVDELRAAGDDGRSSHRRALACALAEKSRR